MRDSHPSREISMGMGTKSLKLMGMGIALMGMGIAQMGMGTLIINVFPFNHIIFPPKSVFDLVDL